MGIFDEIRKLFGGNPASKATSPQSGKRRSVAPGVPQNIGAGYWTTSGSQELKITVQTPSPARPPTSIVPASTVKPGQKTPAPPKPENKMLNLDASNFAPLAGSEIRSQLAGKGSNSWEIFRSGASSVALQWWGNRSIIPPSSDPRTNFIDRGMVGLGLVSADELFELHRVGDEMLILRPQLDNAALIGEQAVQRSKAEREARKKQKKAEVTERQRLHLEAVAHRKATDIVFLGRGVSRGLADRRANVEKLGKAGLPVLAEPAELATALGLTIPRLRWLAFHSDAAERTHYIRFSVPKKSGGTRELAAPHRTLGAAQDWILENILSKIPAHAAAHGFVRGRSTLTNARAHVRPFLLLNCDLKDFFPTINVHRVIGMFAEIGYSPAIATILALLCTESPRRVVTFSGKTFFVASGPRCLPQGASTSPAISNLISRRLDSRLVGISQKLGFIYSRYADDLSFSAPDSQLSPEDQAHPNQRIGYLLARIRHITHDEGFVVNETKTRVQRRNTSQRVTGVVVNSPEPGVPRKTRKRLRAILHKAQSTGLAAQNIRGRPHFESYVRGMISYIYMINPRQSEALRDALGQVPR